MSAFWVQTGQKTWLLWPFGERTNRITILSLSLSSSPFPFLSAVINTVLESRGYPLSVVQEGSSRLMMWAQLILPQQFTIWTTLLFSGTAIPTPRSSRHIPPLSPPLHLRYLQVFGPGRSSHIIYLAKMNNLPLGLQNPRLNTTHMQGKTLHTQKRLDI